MSEYGHDAIRVFGRDFWDERYRSAPRVWSGDPNPQLVAEIAGRPPGRALDAGCGEGADAIWGPCWTTRGRSTSPRSARAASNPDGTEVTVHGTVLMATRQDR